VYLTDGLAVAEAKSADLGHHRTVQKITGFAAKVSAQPHWPDAVHALASWNRSLQRGARLRARCSSAACQVLALCYVVRFQHVLLLDADSMPLVRPELLFQVRQYKQAGNLFWWVCKLGLRLEHCPGLWEACAHEPEAASRAAGPWQQAAK
jgi:hypothetical protein